MNVIGFGHPRALDEAQAIAADIEARLESIVPLLQKEGVLLAYLFGSLAATDEKTLRAPEDVDLAVLTKEGPAWKLWEVLADALGTSRLDLVDLRRASPVLRFEILRSSRPIYISNQDLRSDGSWKRCTSIETPLPWTTAY